jgi:hypothetical protein
MKSWFGVDHPFGWRDILVVLIWITLLVLFIPYEYRVVTWDSYVVRAVIAVLISGILATVPACILAFVLHA